MGYPRKKIFFKFELVVPEIIARYKSTQYINKTSLQKK